LTTKVATPDILSLVLTISVFDDEFIRHLFWRNFTDPCRVPMEGRDYVAAGTLDVVRMKESAGTPASGIKWQNLHQTVKPVTG